MAAEYLNTNLRGKAAAKLAHQLYVVLDRCLPPRLAQISDQPEGDLSNSPRFNKTLITSIKTENGNTEILLERVDRGKSGLIWLFSSQTLDSIPALYDEVNVISVHDVLPPFLVNTRLGGIALFEWLAVCVGVPLFYFFTCLLNRVLKAVFAFVNRRMRKSSKVYSFDFLPVPIRILILGVTIRLLLPEFILPLQARLFWSATSAVMIVAACLWLFILLNSSVEDYVHRRLRFRNLSGTASLLRLGRRVGDVLGVFAAILVMLHYFGVNLTAALAGLGVGGIAVALAAQKTLENVIGGVSLIFDQAMRVGDTLKIGDTLGTVEDIGLRSTRIRTLDRTIVCVPNGQIANMSLEILSSRDRYWFHPTVGLRYESTPTQLRTFLDGVRSMLTEHPSVDNASVRVRFIRLASFSLEVEVVAYIFAYDWTNFLEIQEELLFRVMNIAECAGVQIAFPPQTMYVTANSADVLTGPAKPASPVERQAAAAKSA